MNRKETIEKIEVMQAFVDGKKVQFKYYGSEMGWRPLKRDYPSWNHKDIQYRLQAEPREIWIAKNDICCSPFTYYTEVECRDAYDPPWTPTLFREVIE